MSLAGRSNLNADNFILLLHTGVLLRVSKRSLHGAPRIWGANITKLFVIFISMHNDKQVIKFCATV